LDMCLSNASVVFSTVSSSGKRCMKLAEPFNCMIIDEAAQVKEAESTIALQITGVKYAFLIGDPEQLPTTVISKVAYNAQYGKWLKQSLMCECVAMLRNRLDVDHFKDQHRGGYTRACY